MPLKKIGRAIKKTVRKIVPKEVAGIMQVAAPFVAPYSLPGALALSLGGQLRQGQGRISPFKTLLAVAPSEQFRGFTRSSVPGGQALDKFLYGAPSGAGVGSFRGAQDVGTSLGSPTQGIFGIGGEFGPKEFLKGKLLSPTMKDGVPVLSKSRLAALAATGVSLATASKQIEEEAVAEGASDSDIDALKAEAADFWSTLSSSDFAVTPTLAQGGRVGFALGTRPTAQESGLGGLPIEADMRYSGGFMPYGAKEKADDVPARLSKNEFVFTADAVRAAGGGSVQKGAQKMYNTMKQLEAMGRA
jgi:hypothetical protein